MFCFPGAKMFQSLVDVSRKNLFASPMFSQARCETAQPTIPEVTLTESAPPQLTEARQIVAAATPEGKLVLTFTQS